MRAGGPNKSGLNPWKDIKTWYTSSRRKYRRKGDPEVDSITNLLKALAEAIKPYLGLPEEDEQFNPNDIRAEIDTALEEIDLHDAVSDALGRLDTEYPDEDRVNRMIQDYVDFETDFITNDDFDPSSHYLVTHDELDEAVTDIIDRLLTTEFLIEKLAGDGYTVTRKVAEVA